MTNNGSKTERGRAQETEEGHLRLGNLNIIMKSYHGKDSDSNDQDQEKADESCSSNTEVER